MKRSFNYTGRKRLETSKFDFRLIEKADGPSDFEFRLNGDDHEISDHAVIWVEAYRGPRAMRFQMGTWKSPLNGQRKSLSFFDPGEPVLFRLKVVDETDQKHPIRAWHDRIRPETYSKDGQKKKSVLPVYPCDLGHIAWRIDWEDPVRPVLQVNSRISEARDITSIVKNDPDFAILVFPEVIRQVLTKLLSENADEEEDSLENEWLVFGAKLSGGAFSGAEDDEEENKKLIESWVKSVVQAFGSEMELIARYIKFKSPKSQDHT